MTRHLLTAAFAAMLLACSEAGSDAAPEGKPPTAREARAVLETPFHFLLNLPGYEAAQLTHEADLFSAWGQLVLAGKAGGHPNRDATRKRLAQAAAAAGWRPASELDGLPTPDLPRYGIEPRREDLALQKTSALRAQNPPTRYGCRVWIADDARLVVVAWRVDGE